MKGKQVYEVYKNSDVFVMPSVSEPFRYRPVGSYAMRNAFHREILDKVIKTDYWDIHAMAMRFIPICTNPSLFQYLKEEGKTGSGRNYLGKVGLKFYPLRGCVKRNYGK